MPFTETRTLVRSIVVGSYPSGDHSAVIQQAVTVQIIWPGDAPPIKPNYETPGSWVVAEIEE